MTIIPLACSSLSSLFVPRFSSRMETTTGTGADGRSWGEEEGGSEISGWIPVGFGGRERRARSPAKEGRGERWRVWEEHREGGARSPTKEKRREDAGKGEDEGGAVGRICDWISAIPPLRTGGGEEKQCWGRSGGAPAVAEGGDGATMLAGGAGVGEDKGCARLGQRLRLDDSTEASIRLGNGGSASDSAPSAAN
jgi:hypothetical protein